MATAKNLILTFFIGLVLVCVFSFHGTCFVFAAENLTPNSKASILLEAQTGKVLSEQNSLKELPIASVTKQMSILLVLEAAKNGTLDLESEINASANAANMGGSQVFIDANSSYKAKDLLKAMIVASANDASVALAEKIAGSEEAFVEMMNKKASDLGLEHTNYENCTGLPAPSHYSCAKDVALVMKELLNYPLYFEYSAIWMEDFVHPSGRVTGMANTNKLIRFYEPCDAGKTGSTHEAGFCLSATAKQGDLRLVSVVLGADNSKNRFADAKKQFEWGFANFQATKIVEKSKNFAEFVNLQKAKTTNLVITPEKDFVEVTKKGENLSFETTLNLPKSVQAPLKQGDVVGQIEILKDGKTIETINLIVNQDIEQKGYFETVKTTINKW